ncbi:MAG: ComF family protein [Chitinispirillaceae bacterium]|nr:ComF family protein [Chitinispirillaceae bacterium]
MAPGPALKRTLDGMLERAFDFLFPPLCLLCDTPRTPPDRWLCEACKAELRDNHDRRDPCPICAMNRKRGDCACESGWSHPFDRVYALLDFDPLVQAAMHQIKYRGRKKFARALGGFLFELLPPGFLDDFDALVPLPLHPTRLRKRGYNQSHLIALGIAARAPRTSIFNGILARTRKTTTQTMLDREDRKRNMKGAFGVHGQHRAAVSGKRLLLLDDVVTTGATTAAAARALLDAGCLTVTVLAIARD